MKANAMRDVERSPWPAVRHGRPAAGSVGIDRQRVSGTTVCAVRGMSGNSVDLELDRASRCGRLADLAVRAWVRSSREASRRVRK